MSGSTSGTANYRQQLQNADWLSGTDPDSILVAAHPSFLWVFPQLALGVICAGIGVLLAGVTLLSGPIVSGPAVMDPEEWRTILLAGGGLLFILGTLSATIRYLTWKNTWFILTTDTVIQKRKIIGYDASRISYGNLALNRTNRSPVETLLKFVGITDVGTVHLASPGTDAEEIKMRGIAKFSQIETHLSEKRTEMAKAAE